MRLRVMLDVNVLISRLFALRSGRSDTASALLFNACVDGQCRLGPLAPVASLDLLRTFRRVAERSGVPDKEIEAMADVIEGSFVGGSGMGPLHAVVGGGILPMTDLEDQGVMEAALAGRVELLITENLRDFTSQARADLACEPVSDGVFLFRHALLSYSMVIARKDRAFQWLMRGLAPPPGALARLFPHTRSEPEPEGGGLAP